MKVHMNNKVAKVCRTCNERNTCIQNSKLVKKCYTRWYNTTRRNKKSERLRQAEYRNNNFSKHMLTRFKSKAKKEGRAFNLDEKWIDSQLQNNVCSVTGLSFVMPIYQPGKVGQSGPWSPSVDRINNNLGYTKNNCQLVIWMYNLAKNKFTEVDFMKMSTAFVSKQLNIQPAV